MSNPDPPSILQTRHGPDIIKINIMKFHVTIILPCNWSAISIVRKSHCCQITVMLLSTVYDWRHNPMMYLGSHTSLYGTLFTVCLWFLIIYWAMLQSLYLLSICGFCHCIMYLEHSKRGRKILTVLSHLRYTLCWYKRCPTSHDASALRCMMHFPSPPTPQKN